MATGDSQVVIEAIARVEQAIAEWGRLLAVMEKTGASAPKDLRIKVDAERAIADLQLTKGQLDLVKGSMDKLPGATLRNKEAIQQFGAQAKVSMEEARRKTQEYATSVQAAAAPTKQLGEAAKDTATKSEAMANVMRRLTQLVQLYIASFAVRTVQKFASSIVETQQKLDGMTNALIIARGSLQGANEELEFIGNLTETLGVNFETTAANVAKFAVSANEAGLSLEQQREVIRQVSGGLAVLNADAQTVDGTWNALTQTLNKGTLQSEELVRQLSNRIPGAVPLMAKGLGVATEELKSLLADGLIPADLAVRALGAAMEDELGPGFDRASSSMRGQINQLKKDFFDLSAGIGTTLRPAMTEAIGELRILADSVETLTDAISSSGDILPDWAENLNVGRLQLIGINRVLSLYSDHVENATGFVRSAVDAGREFVSGISAEEEALAALNPELTTASQRTEEHAAGIAAAAAELAAGKISLDQYRLAVEQLSRIHNEDGKTAGDRVLAINQEAKATFEAERIKKLLISATEKYGEALGLTNEKLEAAEVGLLSLASTTGVDVILANDRMRENWAKTLQDLSDQIRSRGGEISGNLQLLIERIGGVTETFKGLGVVSKEELGKSITALTEYALQVGRSGRVTKEQADIIVGEVESIVEAIRRLPPEQQAAFTAAAAQLQALGARYKGFTTEAIEDLKKLGEEMRSSLGVSTSEDIKTSITALDLFVEAVTRAGSVTPQQADIIASKAKEIKDAILEIPGAQGEANERLLVQLDELVATYTSKGDEAIAKVKAIRDALSGADTEADTTDVREKSTEALIEEKKALDKSTAALEQRSEAALLSIDEGNELFDASTRLWEIEGELKNRLEETEAAMDGTAAATEGNSRAMNEWTGAIEPATSALTDYIGAHEETNRSVRDNEGALRDMEAALSDNDAHLDTGTASMYKYSGQLGDTSEALEGFRQRQESTWVALDETKSKFEEQVEIQETVEQRLNDIGKAMEEVEATFDEKMQEMVKKADPFIEKLKVIIELCKELHDCLAATGQLAA